MKLHSPLPRHNQTKYIRTDTHRCQACWACVEICPNQVLGKIDLRFHRHVHIDAVGRCSGCLKCVRVCPHGAISRVVKARPARV